MFLDVFLESLVTEELTIEQDYASLLLTIDGLRHPLFQGLTEPSLGDYNFSIPQYSSLRFPFLQGLSNSNITPCKVANASQSYFEQS